MVHDNAYYAGTREDLIALVPEGARRILEVGCGTGRTGARIKELRRSGVEVTGIEVDREAGEEAKSRLDRVLVGDVEEIDLPFEREYFDCIITGDVLEHLRDPWGLLKKHCAFLKTGGLVIASIPNAAHYRVLKMLRKGEWNYSDAGLLDRGHLRFFTLKTIRAMFNEAGLSVETVGRVIRASRLRRIVNALSGGALIDRITEQYLITARK